MSEESCLVVYADDVAAFVVARTTPILAQQSDAISQQLEGIARADISSQKDGSRGLD